MKKRNIKRTKKRSKRNMKEDYNGWSNWETWNVNLWFDNEYALYQDKVEFITQGRGRLSVRDVKDFVEYTFPNGTPDMDDVNEMNNVDYKDLTESWNMKYEEYQESIKRGIKKRSMREGRGGGFQIKFDVLDSIDTVYIDGDRLSENKITLEGEVSIDGLNTIEEFIEVGEIRNIKVNLKKEYYDEFDKLNALDKKGEYNYSLLDEPEIFDFEIDDIGRGSTLIVDSLPDKINVRINFTTQVKFVASYNDIIYDPIVIEGTADFYPSDELRELLLEAQYDDYYESTKRNIKKNLKEMNDNIEDYEYFIDLGESVESNAEKKGIVLDWNQVNNDINKIEYNIYQLLEKENGTISIEEEGNDIAPVSGIEIFGTISVEIGSNMYNIIRKSLNSDELPFRYDDIYKGTKYKEIIDVSISFS
jgi:hypothetical protein